MDNDLMSTLMGAIDNPETKDKLMNIFSELKSPEPKEEYAPTPPPVPFGSFPGNDLFSKNTFDIMMKIQNAMERLNRRDDSRIGLLNSLKPFMKNGRDKNIDAVIKCIQIINFASGR